MCVNIFYKILFQSFQEMSLFGKSELEKTIEHLTYVNHQVIYQIGFGVYYVVWMTMLIIVLIYCIFLILQNSMMLEQLYKNDRLCTMKTDYLGPNPSLSPITCWQYLNFPSLHFSICKIGIVLVLNLWRVNELIHIKNLKESLAYCKYAVVLVMLIVFALVKNLI